MTLEVFSFVNSSTDAKKYFGNKFDSEIEKRKPLEPGVTDRVKMQEKFRTRKNFHSISCGLARDRLRQQFEKKATAVPSVSSAYEQFSIFKQTKHMSLKVITVL